MKKNNLPNEEYWTKREAYKLKKGLKDLKKIEKELVDEYKKAMNEIGKEISNLFYKYAKDNNLSYSDAKKSLNSSEFKEFKRDWTSYMKLIEETGDEELLLELNTLSMKSRISRLEEMFYQCGKYINEVYESTNKRLQIAYSSTIKDNYYQTIYDIHNAIRVGVSFSYIDNDMIKEILAFPWSGRHYSSRLWSNRTKLKNAMVEELTQMLIQGKGVKEASKALSKRLDADLKNCIRLIHTEHSYFMETASQKAYDELDIDKYKILATLDKRTSKICQDLDGEVFNVKDAVVGVNMPPFHWHPYCRTTTIPYIDDINETRIARDKNNKLTEVSKSMKYKEWYKTFIEK